MIRPCGGAHACQPSHAPRYNTADGAPVCGAELPGVPAASGTGWSAPSFHELPRQ